MISAFFTVKVAGDDLEVILYWPFEKKNHVSKITFVQYYIHRQKSKKIVPVLHKRLHNSCLSGDTSLQERLTISFELNNKPAQMDHVQN